MNALPTPHSPLKILYIVGAARSGSTLLTRALNEFSEFFAIGEMHGLHTSLREAVSCGCGAKVDDCPVWRQALDDAGGLDAADRYETGMKRLRSRDAWTLAARPLWRRRTSGLTDFDGLLQRLYGSVATAAAGERPIIIDESKHPIYGLYLAQRPWVDLSFIHLVRDPGDVARSWANAKPDPGRPSGTFLRKHRLQALSEYVRHNLLASIAVRRSGRPVLRVRYEDYVDDPGSVLTSIRSLVGLPAPTGGEASMLQSRGFEAGENHILASNPDKYQRGWIEVRRNDGHPTADHTNVVNRAAVAVTRFLFGYRA